MKKTEKALALILTAPLLAIQAWGVNYKPQATAVPGSVPTGVNYQGRLEENGFPVTATESMVFAVFDAATGGNNLWTSSPQSVAVTGGLFNAVVPIPAAALMGGGARYMEVTVGGVVLSPREALNSVPYAMVAKTVEGTIDVSTGGLSILPSPAGTPSIFVSSKTGFVGINTSSPATLLHMSSGTLTIDGANPGIAVGISTFVVSSGSVGIGTSAPKAELHVVGPSNSTASPGAWTAAAAFDNAAGSTQLPVEWRVGGAVQGAVRADNSGDLVLSGLSGATFLNFDGGAATVFGNGSHGEAARITSGGDFGIGTSNPALPLDVNGSAQFGSGTTKSTFTAAGILQLASPLDTADGGTGLTSSGGAGRMLVSNGTIWTSAAMSGDAALAGTGALTLATVNANAGSWGSATQAPNITVNGKGLITAASNTTISGVAPGGAAGGDLSSTYPNPTVAKISGSSLGTTTPTSGNILIGNGTLWQTQAMSGDAALAGTGALTLATVNANAGSWGSATQVPTFTVNGKGLITAASNTTISGVPPGGAAGGDLSSTYPNPTVAKINGSSLGTTTPTSGNILIGSGALWQTQAVSGDATLSNTGVVTLANSGVAAGTYKSVTVDAKGRATAGTNPTTLAGYGITDAVQLQGATPGAPQSGNLNISGAAIFGGTVTVQGNAFSVGGSTLAVAGGSVGIGTTNPAYALHNTGSSLVGGQEIVVGTATVQGNAFSVGGSTLTVASGKVGIGTTNPQSALHVAGGAARLQATAGVSGSVKLFSILTVLGTDTCTSLCGSNTTCLAAWTSGGSSSTCGTAAAANRCLCAGFGD